MPNLSADLAWWAQAEAGKPEGEQRCRRMGRRWWQVALDGEWWTIDGRDAWAAGDEYGTAFPAQVLLFAAVIEAIAAEGLWLVLRYDPEALADERCTASVSWRGGMRSAAGPTPAAALLAAYRAARERREEEQS